MTWNEIVKRGYEQFMTHHNDIEYVTRCKDCVHLSSNRIAPEWKRVCSKYGVGKSDNGFCDEAERKGATNAE